MHKLKNYRKKKKAVSTVLAVLLMIAVAVAASLVAYAWSMGYLGFITGRTGKAMMIQSVGLDGSDLKIYVQNVGQGSVSLDPAQTVYVDGILLSSPPVSIDDTQLAEGETATITVSGQSGLADTHSHIIRIADTEGLFAEITVPEITGTMTSTTTTGTITTSTATTTSQTTTTPIQYQVTFDHTGLDGSAIGNLVVTVNGVPANYEALPYSILVNDGATVTYSYELIVASGTPGEQFRVDSITGPASGFTVSGPTTVTGNYVTQYQVTFAASPPAGGTTTPSTATWYDAGATGVSISASANSGYTFSSWSVIGSIVIDAPSSATTTATINGPGTITATFTAAQQTLILRPNGSGSTNLVDYPSTGYNYEKVDETVADGDTTYVYDDDADGNYAYDRYEMQDHGSASGTINSVVVHIQSRRYTQGGSTTNSFARTVLRAGGNNYYSSDITLTDTYADYSSTTYLTNPSGGSWTWSAIDSLQAGVSLYTGDDYGTTQSWARCTQVWIVVIYTP